MRRGRNVGGENALTTFAQRTGGRVFAPTLGAEMDSAFDQILRDLRTQYLLAFYPKDVPLTGDRFHLLQVSTRDPKLRVIARSGYYGEAQQGRCLGIFRFVHRACRGGPERRDRSSQEARAGEKSERPIKSNRAGDQGKEFPPPRSDT